MSYKLIKLFLIILLIYIFPVFLILTRLISFEYRFYVLEVATILVVLYSLLTNVQLNKLGFTTKKSEGVNKTYITDNVNICVTYSNYFYSRMGKNRQFKNSLGLLFIFVFISSPSQEILYRGYLFNLLSEAGLNRLTSIGLSSILYSFVHLIYLDIPTLVITLIIGIFWGMNYEKYRNIYGVIFSHSILGSMAILAGII